MADAADRAGAVMAAVNGELGGAWRLEGRLAGGLLGGAWRIGGADGPAVLKWRDPGSTVPRNPDAPAVVEHLRKAGYPTPAWLASGVTADGAHWWIQELIDGAPVLRLDEAAAERIAWLIEHQRGIRPPTEMSWTAFMRETVKAAPGQRRSLARLAEPYVDDAMPDDELVHCDLSLANILVNDGQIAGVVDIEAAGRGCAVYDLLAAVVNGLVWNAEPAAIARLERFARETYDRPVILVAAVCLVIEALTWAESHYPDRAERLAGRYQTWLETL